MNRRFVAALTASLAISPLCVGQSQALPPIRQIGMRSTVVRDSFGTQPEMRQLSDGRLFIADPGSKRVLLFDSTLQHAVPVLAGDGTTPTRFTAGVSNLFRFTDDTTLFLDVTASALVVIAPNGSIIRTISNPMTGRSSPWYYTTVADPQLHLLYDGSSAFGAVIYADSANSRLLALADSAPILRVSLVSHRLDTVAFLRIPDRLPWTQAVSPGGFRESIPTTNPVAITDLWAMLPDGTVAIVRGHDYHIDWVMPDGTRESSPKLQQHWVRLSDGAKEAIVDSVRQWNEGHRYTKTNVSDDGVLTRYQGRPDRVPDADQLPDYPAPFGGGAVRADADGNVWILRGAVGPLDAGGTSGMSDAPLVPAPRDINNVLPKVYDVVNRHGVIFDRVELPGGTSIIGFGPGVVYLSGRITSKYQVVRVRIR